MEQDRMLEELSIRGGSRYRRVRRSAPRRPAAGSAKASDLPPTVGLPPMLRIDGALQRTNYRPLGPNDTQRLVYDI